VVGSGGLPARGRFLHLYEEGVDVKGGG
jgi:hypothetical protein